MDSTKAHIFTRTFEILCLLAETNAGLSSLASAGVLDQAVVDLRHSVLPQHSLALSRLLLLCSSHTESALRMLALDAVDALLENVCKFRLTPHENLSVPALLCLRRLLLLEPHICRTKELLDRLELLSSTIPADLVQSVSPSSTPVSIALASSDPEVFLCELARAVSALNDLLNCEADSVCPRCDCDM
eukprot:GILI01020248.1.p1 GENE.GILI01020248.1~~GILI01020248.1.p1  ORF type:complete len:204 (+),score=57.88 GILI01020248.1:50-613(+)